MKVSHEVPTPHEYLELRKAAGLRAIDEDAAKTALNRSIFQLSLGRAVRAHRHGQNHR